MNEKVKVMVFGNTPSCDKCRQAESEVRLAVQRFPSDLVVLEEHDAISETGQKYKIVITPTIIVNDTKVAIGTVLEEAKLVEIIEDEIRKSVTKGNC